MGHCGKTRAHLARLARLEYDLRMNLSRTPLRFVVICSVFSSLALANDAWAQFPDLGDIKIPAMESETSKNKKGADKATPVISAQLDELKIKLGDGRVLELREQMGMMTINPEIEMTAPTGAVVELFYEKNKVHEATVPFVYKNARRDAYLTMVVKESVGTWTVKWKPKSQNRTTIVLAEGGTKKNASRPASEGSNKCRQSLIAKGHPSSLLDSCDDVHEACAVALLEANHHPSLLSDCTPEVAPRCAQTLLRKGHHPTLLSDCVGVDDSCAVALLERGDHPTNLSDCGD